MTIQQAYQLLVQQLYALYSDREAQQMADWVLEHITGFKKIDRVLNKQFLLNNGQEDLLAKYTAQLLDHTPVQYVLEEAWFAGMRLFVNQHVLIPRPETEELVEWIISDYAFSANPNLRIADIGTGSGCIPIALKKKLTTAAITAIDISPDALAVAQRNANSQAVDIDFMQADILDNEDWKPLSLFHVIVSNPPYIPKKGAADMQSNVLQHEPYIALFVPDDDALLFYKAIANFGLTHLTTNGHIYVEINEGLGKEVSLLLENQGYTDIELRQDLQGKDRMVKAKRAITFMPSV